MSAFPSLPPFPLSSPIFSASLYPSHPASHARTLLGLPATFVRTFSSIRRAKLWPQCSRPAGRGLRRRGAGTRPRRAVAGPCPAAAAALCLRAAPTPGVWRQARLKGLCNALCNACLPLDRAAGLRSTSSPRFLRSPARNGETKKCWGGDGGERLSELD